MISNMADPKAIVFDLDGTLIHSAPDLQLAANEALKSIGRAPLDVLFYAMNAEGESAEHLATNAGNALLVFERTTWIGQ